MLIQLVTNSAPKLSYGENQRLQGSVCIFQFNQYNYFSFRNIIIPELAKEISILETARTINFLTNLSEPKPVIIDFDETLFLRNSTEEYLNSIRPKAVGALFLFFLELFRPWQWLPGKVKGIESKDWIRVLLCTVFFPWTLLVWKKRTSDLARRYENQPLSAAVNSNINVKPVIATHGFRFIVKPLLKRFSVRTDEVAGCRFLGGIFDRQKGKEELLAKVIAPEAMARSAVITDSAADNSLLKISAYPFLVNWPESRYIPALSDAYLPLFYLECVKRPGQRFIRWAIVENQLIALILAYSFLSSMPLLHIAGMIFLLFSFWCIYEIGYYENDRVAELYEKKPVLSDTYHQYKNRMSFHQPWLFAAVAGVVGATLIHTAEALSWNFIFEISKLPQLIEFREILYLSVYWLAGLATTRVVFAFYNYSDAKSRIWIYPLLQALKYFVFVTVTATNTLGALLLLSQIFADWLPYTIYRCGGKRELLDEQPFKLLFFLLLTLVLILTVHGGSLILNWQAVFILAWLTFHHKKQISELVKSAHSIHRHKEL